MNTSDKVRTQLHAAIESECIDDAGESLRGAARTDWLLANVAKYVGTRYHVTAKIGTHGNTKGRITFRHLENRTPRVGKPAFKHKR